MYDASDETKANRSNGSPSTSQGPFSSVGLNGPSLAQQSQNSSGSNNSSQYGVNGMNGSHSGQATDWEGVDHRENSSRIEGPSSPTSSMTIKERGISKNNLPNGIHTTPSDTRNPSFDKAPLNNSSLSGPNMTRSRLLPLTTSVATNSVTITSADSAALSSGLPNGSNTAQPYSNFSNGSQIPLSVPQQSQASNMPSTSPPKPNTFPSPSNGQVHATSYTNNANWPALHLLPLNDTFIPKQILLNPPGARVKIGRQTNAKTAPASNNGYFDSKVLSRMHAEVWFETQPAKVYIKDVGSSNGTFINGDRLSLESQKSDVFELHSEDMVEFGIDIASEDNKTVLHHKVAAQAYICASAEEADRLAKQMPSIQLKLGLGPSQGNGMDGGAHPMRRMSRAGIASSGLSFDHVLSCLQSELQKSRETGSELNGLTSTMTEIRSHLSPGSGQPPPLPAYPMTRVPPLQAVNNQNNNAQINTAAISNLQTQLSETQNSLTNHVDKLDRLEGLLSQHEILQREVTDLREQMRVAKAEMDDLLSQRSIQHSTISRRVDFDDDEDDARSVASVDTVMPSAHEDRVHDLPTEDALDVEPDTSEHLPNGVSTNSKYQGRESLTDQDDNANALLRTQNATLLTRLDNLSAQLESATQLSLSLQEQHAEAAEMTHALQERIVSLEERIAKETDKVPTADAREDLAKEHEARWEGWKVAFERSWRQDKDAWDQEREKLRQIISQWEEKEAQLATALSAAAEARDATSRSSSSSSRQRQARPKRRRPHATSADPTSSGSSSSSEAQSSNSKGRSAKGTRDSSLGRRSTITPALGSNSSTNASKSRLNSSYKNDNDDAYGQSDSSDGTTTAVFSRPVSAMSATKASQQANGSNQTTLGTLGAIGVAALALTVWSVMSRTD